MINENDSSDYLFVSENTTYGNIMQSALTYHLELLKILNKWVYNLNTTIINGFNDTNLIKTYIFEYPMYSDIFYTTKSKKYTLTLYNIDLLKNISAILSFQEKTKILKNCQKNIELLTYDILALLNVFKHFQENQEGIDYIKQTGTSFDNKKYVYEKYLDNCNIWLTNYYTVIDILSNNK